MCYPQGICGRVKEFHPFIAFISCIYAIRVFNSPICPVFWSKPGLAEIELICMGDHTLPSFQPPHFDPPPIPSYSSHRVHSETPIYVPPHSSLWVMGHHSTISSSICTHLHADAHLCMHMHTYACRCTSITPPKLTLHAYACMCIHMKCICMQMCACAYPLRTHSMHSIHLHA